MILSAVWPPQQVQAKRGRKMGENVKGRQELAPEGDKALAISPQPLPSFLPPPFLSPFSNGGCLNIFFLFCFGFCFICLENEERLCGRLGVGVPSHYSTCVGFSLTLAFHLSWKWQISSVFWLKNSLYPFTFVFSSFHWTLQVAVGLTSSSVMRAKTTQAFRREGEPCWISLPSYFRDSGVLRWDHCNLFLFQLGSYIFAVF